MNRTSIPVLILIAFLGLFVFSRLAYAETKDYWSPDKTLYARVLATGEWKEIRIEIRTSIHNILSQKDFTSPDAQHGLTLARCAWSPDSNFFVFSTWSSGGHQPWQSPTFFYSRQDNFIHSFSKFLPPIANDEFSLKAPDFLTITIWTPFCEQGIITSIQLPISFKLSDLLKKQD